jgi:hypothetical protein
MRNKVTVTIDDPQLPNGKPNRDAGKVFEITEMSSDKAERWAMRALLALTNTGVHIPQGIEGAGMAGIAHIGFQMFGLLDFDVVEPLLAEMMTCINIQVGAVSRPVNDDFGDIEEVATRLKLRRAWFELHTGFSLPVLAPTMGSQPTGSQSG